TAGPTRTATAQSRGDVAASSRSSGFTATFGTTLTFGKCGITYPGHFSGIPTFTSTEWNISSPKFWCEAKTWSFCTRFSAQRLTSFVVISGASFLLIVFFAFEHHRRNHNRGFSARFLNIVPRPTCLSMALNLPPKKRVSASWRNGDHRFRENEK